MPVDLQEVDRIAGLAKLEFSEAEKARFVQQFNDILSYIEKISELDLTAVEPTIHMYPDAERTRSDVVQPGLSQQQALSNAPVSKQGLFSVPKVIGG